MTPETATKAARRASRALRHALNMERAATSDAARKRHARRAAQARKALSGLDFDARRIGAAVPG